MALRSQGAFNAEAELWKATAKSAQALAIRWKTERDQLREECELAAEQGRLVGLEAERYRQALERLHHLVVSPGSLDRNDICAEGKRVIEEALSA